MGIIRRKLRTHEDEAVDIRVPDVIQVGEVLGRGARSMGYAAELDGHKVAIKFYRPRFVHKYRHRYKVELAQFEFDRNAAFRAVPGLSDHTVEPLRVLREEDGHTPAFVQEYIQGESLTTVMRRLGHLPPEILKQGKHIADTACAAGLHDLDMHDGNIMVVGDDGHWKLLIYDFNLMPQYLHAPNPFVKLLYKVGLRKRSGRDYLCLKRWAYLGEHGGYDPKQPHY